MGRRMAELTRSGKTGGAPELGLRDGLVAPSASAAVARVGAPPSGSPHDLRHAPRLRRPGRARGGGPAATAAREQLRHHLQLPEYVRGVGGPPASPVGLLPQVQAGAAPPQAHLCGPRPRAAKAPSGPFFCRLPRLLRGVHRRHPLLSGHRHGTGSHGRLCREGARHGGDAHRSRRPTRPDAMRSGIPRRPGYHSHARSLLSAHRLVFHTNLSSIPHFQYLTNLSLPISHQSFTNLSLPITLEIDPPLRWSFADKSNKMLQQAKTADESLLG